VSHVVLQLLVWPLVMLNPPPVHNDSASWLSRVLGNSHGMFKLRIKLGICMSASSTYRQFTGGRGLYCASNPAP
jgi:hypothetical protein